MKSACIVFPGVNSVYQNIESYLNLAIRVGSPVELKDYPEVMDKFLKTDFKFRIKNFGFYSALLASEIDLNNKAIKDAQQLMSFRTNMSISMKIPNITA